MKLETPLSLASGTVLRNRIAKAAMEEQLAGPGRLPDGRLFSLYRRWGRGGAGLLITGHVMVDRRAVAQPGDVVLEEESPLGPFTDWAAAAHEGGAQVWMQINHPGRVVLSDTKGLSWAPSAVPINLGALSKVFAPPSEISEVEIGEVVERFAVTAALAQQSGFDGVEIHAAHGYLISQFLSPLTNRRRDAWGGSLENRAKFLLQIVKAIKARTRSTFAVGVKLNSADFQRGGFDFNDAERVIAMLAVHGVDLVELSGGSVESLATSGYAKDGRTLAREAYFLELAERLTRTSPIPLMLTGGIRRRAVALQVLESGYALAGVASALAFDPEIPRGWLEGSERPHLPTKSWIASKPIRAAALQAVVTSNLHRLAQGQTVNRARPLPFLALVWDRLRRAADLKQYLGEKSQRELGHPNSGH